MLRWLQLAHLCKLCEVRFVNRHDLKDSTSKNSCQAWCQGVQLGWRHLNSWLPSSIDAFPGFWRAWVPSWWNHLVHRGAYRLGLFRNKNWKIRPNWRTDWGRSRRNLEQYICSRGAKGENYRPELLVVRAVWSYPDDGLSSDQVQVWR